MEESKFSETYNSFSGADIVTVFTPKGGTPVIFGTLQTITYSIYRPTTQVYVLGQAMPSGFVRGNRTIAGTLIFTVFDRHALYNAIKYGFSVEDPRCMNIKPDELPPFDVTINFMNEYGKSSYMTIRDIRIISEGQTMSIEDRITENTMQYIAADIDMMRPDILEER